MATVKEELNNSGILFFFFSNAPGCPSLLLDDSWFVSQTVTVRALIETIHYHYLNSGWNQTEHIDWGTVTWPSLLLSIMQFLFLFFFFSQWKKCSFIGMRHFVLLLKDTRSPQCKLWLHIINVISFAVYSHYPKCFQQCVGARENHKFTECDGAFRLVPVDTSGAEKSPTRIHVRWIKL